MVRKGRTGAALWVADEEWQRRQLHSNVTAVNVTDYTLKNG